MEATLLPHETMKGLKRRKVGGNDKRQFASRCSFMDFKKTFLECSQEVQTAFMQTPFKWFALYDFPRRDAEFYAEAINLYCPEKSSFLIAGTMLELTVEHVARITGLGQEGEELCIKEKQRLPPSLFRIKYFAKMDPNCTLAKAALRNLREREDSDLGDRVEERNDQLKLLILVLFGAFLFPHGDYALYPGIFEYVEDLPNINKYAWAKAVHKLLHQGMTDILKKKNGQKPLGYLKGCSSLLTVWAYDVLDIAKPIKDGGFPTVSRWSFQTNVSSLLKEKQLELSSLSPTLIKAYGEETRLVVENHVAQPCMAVELAPGPVEVMGILRPCSVKENDRPTTVVSEKETARPRSVVEPNSKPRVVSEKETAQARPLIEPRSKPAEVPRTEPCVSMSSERELLETKIQCNRYERLWLEQQRDNLQLRETIEMYKKENESLRGAVTEWERKFDETASENQNNLAKMRNLQAENMIFRDMVVVECSHEQSSSPQQPKT